METIQATVSSRLLTKADRLFTGSLQGRVIELLQNARRAGATKVSITNKDHTVYVYDNGRGIEDFSRLLDLGSSGWQAQLEHSEDPAGVGVFCLAPRPVTIRSHGRMLTITRDGWTGAPLQLMPDPRPVAGTLLAFEDEPWTHERVQPDAVFTGLQVTVDHKPCARAAFLGEHAAHYPELGCRIEVRDTSRLGHWHDRWHCDRNWSDVLVNFHGQVVGFPYRPVSDRSLHFLVDMTGEPTDIRLMLPARTCLVENEAFERLKAAIEREAYRHAARHTATRRETCERCETALSCCHQ